MDPHQAAPATPIAMFASLWRNRYLIVQMTQREIASRYRGSYGGVAWSLINPLLMLAIYTFVFSVIFKSHWGLDPNESKALFAIILFPGLIVFGIFAEMINRAPTLITTHASYVTKVVFPLDILPWVALGSSLFHSFISFLVLLAAQAAITFSIPWTFVLIPFSLLPLIFLTVGLSWFFAATGVYVRDIGQFTAVITTMLMFLSAVFYPLTTLPPEYQFWLQFNPLVLIVSESRKALVLGQPPDWASLGVTLLSSLIVAFAGFWWFQKLRKGFADVI